MNANESGDRRWDVTEDWQFENMALQDLTDVIFDMDENQARRLLLLIAGSAQLDAPESKFAAKVWKRFEPVIQAWVDSKVEQAAERSGLS